jgi:cytochrome b561
VPAIRPSDFCRVQKIAQSGYIGLVGRSDATSVKEAPSSMRRNSPTQYGSIARFLHWAIAALIVVTIPCGLVMANIGPGATQNFLYVTHESIGLTVLALASLRLIWRLADPPPPLPASVPPLQALLARLNHRLLYLLLFLMPASGYLFVIAGGFPMTYFALLDVPRLVDKNEGLSKLMETAHLSLQFAVYALVVGHVGAALHHHLVKRDGVLGRMWPERNR